MWFVLMLVSAATALVLWRYDEQVTEENHIIENSQVVLLLLACLIHSLRARRRTYRFDMWYRTGLALLCLSFAVRELDIDAFGPAPLWPNIELVVRGAVVLMWVVYIGLLVPRTKWLSTRLRQAFLSPCALYTLLGCVLYVLSWPFDKQQFALDESVSQLVEETIQLIATIAFLAAATTPAVRKLRDEPRG